MGLLLVISLHTRDLGSKSDFQNHCPTLQAGLHALCLFHEQKPTVLIYIYIQNTIKHIEQYLSLNIF